VFLFIFVAQVSPKCSAVQCSAVQCSVVKSLGEFLLQFRGSVVIEQEMTRRLQCDLMC
jgi:hypothetical protein